MVEGHPINRLDELLPDHFSMLAYHIRQARL